MEQILTVNNLSIAIGTTLVGVIVALWRELKAVRAAGAARETQLQLEKDTIQEKYQAKFETMLEKNIELFTKAIEQTATFKATMETTAMAVAEIKDGAQRLMANLQNAVASLKGGA